MNHHRDLKDASGKFVKNFDGTPIEKPKAPEPEKKAEKKATKKKTSFR